MDIIVEEKAFSEIAISKTIPLVNTMPSLINIENIIHENYIYIIFPPFPLILPMSLLFLLKP